MELEEEMVEVCMEIIWVEEVVRALETNLEQGSQAIKI
jgi:hypothetical protein